MAQPQTEPETSIATITGVAEASDWVQQCSPLLQRACWNHTHSNPDASAKAATKTVAAPLTLIPRHTHNHTP